MLDLVFVSTYINAGVNEPPRFRKLPKLINDELTGNWYNGLCGIEVLGGYDVAEDNTKACQRSLDRLRQAMPDTEFQTLGRLLGPGGGLYDNYDQSSVYIRRTGALFIAR